MKHVTMASRGDGGGEGLPEKRSLFCPNMNTKRLPRLKLDYSSVTVAAHKKKAPLRGGRGVVRKAATRAVVIGLVDLFVASHPLRSVAQGGTNAVAPGVSNAVTASSVVFDLGYNNVTNAYLLALVSTVDERPLYLDDALLAVQLANGRWRLVHACRNPEDRREAHRRWVEFTVEDSNIPRFRDLDRVPTPLDVAEFIEDSSFHFRPDKGYRLIKGEVFYDTWKKALGYRPTYKFESASP